MCSMLPVLPEAFPCLWEKEEARARGGQSESEWSCERKDAGGEVLDNNDNVNALNITEMIDKLNKECASKPNDSFHNIEVNSVCSEIWL